MYVYVVVLMFNYIFWCGLIFQFQNVAFSSCSNYFQESPIGNSDSRTGLTRNPINGVPSARLWRKLQIIFEYLWTFRGLASKQCTDTIEIKSC